MSIFIIDISFIQNDDLSRLKSELVGIVNNKNIDSALLTGLSAPNQPVRVSFDVSEHKSTDQRVHFDSQYVYCLIRLKI